MEESQQPLVSIAIALYNKENSIYRTLKSLQMQTYQNFECIIVDDHSTDNSVNIVYECFCKNDKRFKLIVNSTKEKYVDAHNLSYKLCSGKYLFRVDADDLFSSDYLEFNVNYLDEHPEYDAISSYSYFKSIDDNTFLFVDSQNEHVRSAFSDEEIDWFNACPAHSMLGNTIVWSNPTSVIRKSFFEKHKPKYSFYTMGDYIFWYCVLANGGKLHVIKEPYSCRMDYVSNQDFKVSSDKSFYTLSPRINFVMNTYKYKALEYALHYDTEQRFDRSTFGELITKYKNEANVNFEEMVKEDNSYNEYCDE